MEKSCIKKDIVSTNRGSAVNGQSNRDLLHTNSWSDT